ncbi:unnamed protein product, partial [Strongylus vulgaris]
MNYPTTNPTKTGLDVKPLSKVSLSSISFFPDPLAKRKRTQPGRGRTKEDGVTAYGESDSHAHRAECRTPQVNGWARRRPSAGDGLVLRLFSHPFFCTLFTFWNFSDVWDFGVNSIYYNQ